MFLFHSVDLKKHAVFFFFFYFLGLITTGTAEHYLESYVLFFSKDRRNWKLYKGVLSKEKKVSNRVTALSSVGVNNYIGCDGPQVFEAYTDGHPRVLNSLFPPVVTRFVRLQPLSWRGRASAQVQVLGCPAPKSRSATSEYSPFSPGTNLICSQCELICTPDIRFCRVSIRRYHGCTTDQRHSHRGPSVRGNTTQYVLVSSLQFRP